MFRFEATSDRTPDRATQSQGLSGSAGLREARGNHLPTINIADSAVRTILRSMERLAFNPFFPQHVALARHDNAPDIEDEEMRGRRFMPRWEDVLARLGVLRVATRGYDHQKYFIKILLREVARLNRGEGVYAA